MKRTLLFVLTFFMIACFASSCYAQWRMRAFFNLKQANELQRTAKSKEDLEKALAKCREALAMFEQHNGARGKAAALHQMGVINRKLGRYQESLKLQQEALSVKKSLGDRGGEAAALIDLGKVQSLLGRHGDALRHFREALEVNDKLGNDVVDGTTLLSVAVAYDKLGQHRKAVELSERAVQIAEKLGNRTLGGMARINLGKIHQNMGLYHKALKSYEKALDIAHEENNSRAEGICLRNIASVYAITGDYARALQYYEKALANCRKTRNAHLEGSVYNSIGQVYAQTGEFEKALTNYRKGLEIFDKIGVSVRGPNHLIANVYMDAGDLDKAEPYVKAAGSNASVGRFHLLNSDYAKAKESYEKVLGFGEKAGNTNALFTGHTGLGRVNEVLEDYRKAEEHYGKAMNIAEESRSGLLPSERVHFFRVKINGFHRMDPAKGLTRVRLKGNRGADSVESSEATRARAFADNISLRSGQAYSGVPKHVLEQEDELVSRLASLKKERDGISEAKEPERYRNLTGGIEQVEKDLKGFVDKLRLDYSPYASVKYPRPVKLKDSAVRDDEHIIIYDVLDEGVGVKHLRGKQIVQTFFIRWKQSDLESAVDQFRKPFEQVKLREFDPDLAHTLFKRLLSPVLAEIPERTPVMIIPDGVLAILPFEALVMSGNAIWRKAEWGEYPADLKYFGDAYPVSYYQSITALTLARSVKKNRKPPQTLLVVADPVFQSKDERAQPVTLSDASTEELHLMIDETVPAKDTDKRLFHFQRLPETAILAENLRKLYGGRSETLTGLKANKADLLEKVAPNLGAYAWIVFATHGLVGNLIPGVSEPFLVLTMVPPGTDGFLRMTDVLGFDMNAELVALPACQTGLGIDQSGEGVMSMGRAFQYAGARSVLMSLWSVAEGPAVKLVEGFFGRITQGDNKQQSLQFARSDLRQQGYDHPFFWAAFVLVGEAD